MKKTLLILLMLAGAAYIVGTFAQNQFADDGSEKQELFAADEIHCLESWDAHALNSEDENSKKTLSMEEWTEYLKQMGIESLCIPEPLGAPVVNVDWTSDDKEGLESETARKINITFENRLRYGGWGDMYIDFATYDFGVGEYPTFSVQEDYEKIQNDTAKQRVEVAGKDGVSKVFYIDAFGLNKVQKVSAIPQEDRYVAFVYTLKGSYDAPTEEFFNELHEGNFPNQDVIDMGMVNMMLDSIVWKL